MADQILQQTCGDIDAMTVAVICETCGKVKQAGRPHGFTRPSANRIEMPPRVKNPVCCENAWCPNHGNIGEKE